MAGMAEDAATRVVRGSSLLLLGQLSSNLIALGAFMIIARGISKAEMGVATIISLLITLGVILSDAGVSVSVIRFISEARGKNTDFRPLAIASIFTRGVLAVLYSAILMVLANRITLLLLGSTSNLILLYLAAISVIFTGFATTFYSTLIGLDRMLGVCLSYILSSLIGYSLSVLLIIKGWGVMGYVLSWVLSGFIGSLVSGAFLIKAVSFSLNEGKKVLKAARMLIIFSAPMLITNLANYAFNCFDLFALTSLASQEELGMYSVAMKAYTVITMIPMNIAMALFPYYGERYGQEKLSAIKTATSTVSRYLSLLYMPVALGLSAIAEPVLVVFAGAKYVGSSPMLMIFGFFGALTTFVPMMGYLMITYKRTKQYMAANLASITCALSLAPVLIPHLGALLGMALIRGVALLLLLIFYMLGIKNIASVDYQFFAKSLIGSSLMALAVYLIQAWLHEPFLLPLYVFVGAAVYGLYVRALKMLGYNDVVLLSRALPGSLKRIVLSVGSLISHKK